MAPKNSEFSLEQISFISLDVPDGKIFLDDRDPDLNYFNKMNIPSTETIYMNKTGIKKTFYMRHKDLRTFLFFMLTLDD